MCKVIEPFTEEEIDKAETLEGGTPMEAVFSAPLSEDAFALVEQLFKERFVSIQPSQKLSDVSIIRPEGEEGQIVIVAHTGSQQVRHDDQDIFEAEMEELANECGCFYICAGHQLAASASNNEIVH